MSTDLARRALELVDQALQMNESRRAAWLREACGSDKALEAEVLAMLNLAPAAQGFLPLAEAITATQLPTYRHEWEDKPLAVEIVPGSQLGDFKIEKQIGAGGMGVVYRAQQISLHRPVALKVLPTYLRSSANANTRFRREIEASARLHHTNIVSVYATGDEGGTLYYAMELIDGPPLSHLLEHLRSQPVPELESATPADNLPAGLSASAASTPVWAIQTLTGEVTHNNEPQEVTATKLFEGSEGDYFDRIARALADVADALGYAHHHDVVHRDVKPSNLLLSSDGRLHISDFGLARFMQVPGMTRTGECLGTPFYMAPEQILSESDLVDGRADIYGLGATLYELLTLQPPFVGDTRERIINQITNNEPTPPRKLNKRVPHDLQTICLKALEKNPADRYQSGAVMASDLRAYANRFAISARRAGPIARAAKWSRRHRGLSAAIAAASALALIAMFFAFAAHRSQSLWTETQQERVFERAIMAALEGKRKDAQAAVAEARQLGAPLGKMQLLEGQVDMLGSGYARAYDHFTQAAAEMPDSVAAQALLARCCIARHFYQQGEEVFQHCESLQSHTLEDYLHLARVEAFYDAAKAAKTLDEAINRNRSSLVARLIRGEVQVGLAQDTADPTIAEAALDDYRIAAELLGNTPLVTSGHMRALLAAATAYEVHGQMDKHEEMLHKAGTVAKRLKSLNAFRAQLTLAFYYDYLGDVEQAIVELKKFERRQILYLVLALVREGRYDEAKDACGKMEGGDRTDRQLKFFRALIEATAGDSPSKVRAHFPADGQVKLNPIHELLSVYTISRLVDPSEETRRQCQSLEAQQKLPAFREGWLPHISKYACGELSSTELLAAAGTARKDLCEAHYYIALAQLAKGNRDLAAEHFKSSIDTGMFNYFEHNLSRALLAQLQRNPLWPSWIPSASKSNTLR